MTTHSAKPRRVAPRPPSSRRVLGHSGASRARSKRTDSNRRATQNRTRSQSKFESLLKEMLDLHNRKAHDYAKDSDRFSNFKEAGIFSGIPTQTIFEVMIGIKQARLKELMTSGKTPNNESIRDTLLDRCVYSILALQFFDENKDQQ